jgi:hypothetical protein
VINRGKIPTTVLEDVKDIENIEDVEEDIEELVVVVVEREDALLNVVL